MRFLLMPHPLLIAFQQILNLEYAIEHAPITSEERRDLYLQLNRLRSYARLN